MKYPFAIVVMIMMCAPFVASAVGTAADAQCIPALPTGCGCGTREDSKGRCTIPNKFGCTCTDMTAGRASVGTCTATNVCTGKTSEGQGGGAEALKAIGDIMKQIMDMMKGGGGGEGGGQPPPNSTTCTQYTPVSTPSSNPCEYYVPPVSGTITTTDSGVGDTLLDTLRGSTTVQTPVTPTPATTTNGVQQNTNLNNSGRLAPGLQGDVVVATSGASIVVRNRDITTNTEVAGFYGYSNTGSLSSTGLAARLCQARPWSGIISYVIPATFFDSLCEWRGYSTKAAAPVVPVTSSPRTGTSVKTPVVKKTATTTITVASTTTAVLGGPAGIVDIWAVPASVPIGSRTSVFWNTKNVSSCTVTSPDGSFNEKTLSGGASTVPLSGPTTFSLSCIGLDGKPATDFVTVKMSL